MSPFLYQLTVVLLFVGDPGTSHKHGGKSLSGEQALEKFNIALVGRSPFPFSVAPSAAPVTRCGRGQGKSAAGKIQTQVTLGAMSP